MCLIASAHAIAHFFVDCPFLYYFIIYMEIALIWDRSHLLGSISSKMTKSPREIVISEAREKIVNKVWRQVTPKYLEKLV